MSPDLDDPTRVAPDSGDDEAPAWFDGPGFLDGAKTHFMRLQTAWEQADLRDIRDYTHPSSSPNWSASAAVWESRPNTPRS